MALVWPCAPPCERLLPLPLCHLPPPALPRAARAQRAQRAQGPRSPPQDFPLLLRAQGHARVVHTTQRCEYVTSYAQGTLCQARISVLHGPWTTPVAN